MKRVKEVQPRQAEHRNGNGNGKANGTVVVSKVTTPAPFVRRPARNQSPIDATAKPTGRLAPRIAGIGHDVITITPEMAQRYLEGKLPNRNIKEPDIERYVRDIKAGTWHLNGESMIFSGDEESVKNGLPTAGLLDGQQRSWAIFLAGMPVQALVVWGVPPESMVSIDTGAKRTFGDVLTIKGKKNATTMAGAARWMFWYENGYETIRSGAENIRATHHELAATVEKHPSLEEAATIVMGSKARSFVSPVVCTFVVAGAIEHGLRDEAIAFMDVLGKGMDLTREWGPRHPVYHLYQRLQAERANLREKKPLMHVTCAYVLKTFNLFASKQEIRSLKWNGHSAEKPEPFPRFESADVIRKAARKAIAKRATGDGGAE